MAFRNTVTSYGSVAKFLHWLMALLILGMLALGFIMSDLERTPEKLKLYNIHKSLGMIILAVAGVRLLWKAMNIQPVLPASIPKFERFLAHAGHATLYVLMFAMPLSGWLMSSAAGFPVSVFGWITAPDLVSPAPGLKGFFNETHETLAIVIAVVAGLHVLAALLHHFHSHNNVLRRMLPFTKGDDHAPEGFEDSDIRTGC